MDYPTQNGLLTDAVLKGLPDVMCHVQRKIGIEQDVNLAEDALSERVRPCRVHALDPGVVSEGHVAHLLDEAGWRAAPDKGHDVLARLGRPAVHLRWQ